MIPIHKSGSSQDLGNFRPISILPALSKLIERHIYDSFYLYLVSNNLLYSAQSGFRKSFSCETALAQMIHKWTSAINHGLLNGIIYIDLRKAFDLIDHGILLKKLELYRCTALTVMWFKSYLKDREQCTSFKGILSERATVKSGVPQGSILGPLLFILFINDMPLHTEGDMDMYADDSTLSTVGKNINELEDTLNHDLQNVDKWCKNNRMLINVQKTKAMIMTTWQKRLALNERREMNVFLNNEKIQSVECEKLLGVIVNQDVSWEPHIVKTLKTVNRLLGVLWRIKKYLPLKTRKLFYTSFILPHMDYCSSIWGGSPHIKKLFLYQKRAARVILDVNIRHHSSRDLFISLNWMPIKDRIEYRKSILVYTYIYLGCFPH